MRASYNSLGFFLFLIEVHLTMTSLLIGEQEESLFLLHEQPPPILQQAESLDGIKSIQHLLSASSSLASTTLPNRTQQSFRPSTASHEVIPPPLRFSTNHSRYSNSNDVDSFVRQFEQRLDEHRHQSQKEYDRKIQQMIESKNHELDTLRNRYESKLHELEETNRQLEIQSGQINEENKRLKIELEHQKQQYRIELVRTSPGKYTIAFLFSDKFATAFQRIRK